MSDRDFSWQTLFLRNRHLLVLSIVVALAAGIFGVQSLQRFEDPRIVNRYPIIITPFPGASAERVETLVTEKLEDELAEVSAIKNMTSTSLSGVSIVVIELLESVDKFTYQEVDRVFVRGTLSDGELVVSEGLHRLVPDQRVRSATSLAFSVKEQS